MSAINTINHNIEIIDLQLSKLGAEAVHAAANGHVDRFNELQAKCDSLEGLKALLVKRAEFLATPV
jgi:hypothetical protein